MTKTSLCSWSFLQLLVGLRVSRMSRQTHALLQHAHCFEWSWIIHHWKDFALLSSGPHVAARVVPNLLARCLCDLKTWRPSLFGEQQVACVHVLCYSWTWAPPSCLLWSQGRSVFQGCNLLALSTHNGWISQEVTSRVLLLAECACSCCYLRRWKSGEMKANVMKS